MNCDAILFDLDGTLVDSAPDLAFAVNELLREHDREPLPFELIRPTVSNGTVAMLGLAFNVTTDDEEFGDLRDQFLDIYEKNLFNHSVMFEGCQELLDELVLLEIPWGIVTNKPGHLTDPLLEIMQLSPTPGCVVSGDTTPFPKPSPEPLYEAARRLGCDPESSIYVGDANRDIEAAQRAGMASAVALWGYIDEDDQPRDWGADWCIAEPLELLDLIEHD